MHVDMPARPTKGIEAFGFRTLYCSETNLVFEPLSLFSRLHRFSMNQMIFVDTRPLARRSPLAISVLLHIVLIFLLAITRTDVGLEGPVRLESHRRTLILLNMRDFPHRAVAHPKSTDGQGALASARAGASGTGANARPLYSPAPAQQNDTSASASAPLQQHRKFELSAAVPRIERKQTIVQIDVPPDVALKPDLPLPNIVIWTAQQLPPFRRKFVAPPLQPAHPKVIAQNIPPAPELELPNNQSNVAELKIAALLLEQPRHLILPPPASTAPIRIPNPEQSSQVPQIVVPVSNPADSAALIALVESPIKPNGMIVVPPANQSAEASGVGKTGQGSGSGNNSGNGNEQTRPGAAGNAVANGGTGNLASNGHGGTGLGTGAESGSAPGSSTGSGAGGSNGVRAGTTGNGDAGSGLGAAGNGLGGGLDATALPGVTRISLPKDGKYAVVVMGSSQGVPYPESVGALTGKTVYTVYLNVGLHKRWVLQYCLTKEVEATIPRGSSTPLEAPWPFLIFRPDHLVQPSDYVILHGQIDKDGRFDQLAMVFPDQFEQKDLLMSSLKIWAFRPASRDRVPVPVEVLLIIPGES